MQGAYMMGKELDLAVNLPHKPTTNAASGGTGGNAGGIGNGASGAGGDKGGDGSSQAPEGIGVEVSVGFQKQKTYNEQNESDVVGSTAVAGNALSIVARADNKEDSQNGTLLATAAQLSGKDVDLEAGWDTTSQISKSKSMGALLGVDIGISGDGFDFGVTG